MTQVSLNKAVNVSLATQMIQCLPNFEGRSFTVTEDGNGTEVLFDDDLSSDEADLVLKVLESLNPTAATAADRVNAILNPPS